MQVKRTWPITPTKDTLEERWRRLLTADDRAAAFRETRDRKVSSRPKDLWSDQRLDPLDSLGKQEPMPRLERYAYRAFDRQWVIADPRLADYCRPELWRSSSERQV